MARIHATPLTIPENDSFRTNVTLDASDSADPIDDPQGASPLAFEWEIVGDEYRFASGGPTDAQPVVQLLGSRPATVRLTVTDSEGSEATASIQLRLTVAP